MRRHEYESRYNPAVTELSRALRNDGGINPDIMAKITRVLEGQIPIIVLRSHEILLMKVKVTLINLKIC